MPSPNELINLQVNIEANDSSFQKQIRSTFSDAQKAGEIYNESNKKILASNKEIEDSIKKQNEEIIKLTNSIKAKQEAVQSTSTTVAVEELKRIKDAIEGNKQLSREIKERIKAESESGNIEAKLEAQRELAKLERNAEELANRELVARKKVFELKDQDLKNANQSVKAEELAVIAANKKIFRLEEERKINNIINEQLKTKADLADKKDIKATTAVAQREKPNTDQLEFEGFLLNKVLERKIALNDLIEKEKEEIKIKEKAVETEKSIRSVDQVDNKDLAAKAADLIKSQEALKSFEKELSLVERQFAGLDAAQSFRVLLPQLKETEEATRRLIQQKKEELKSIKSNSEEADKAAQKDLEDTKKAIDLLVEKEKAAAKANAPKTFSGQTNEAALNKEIAAIEEKGAIAKKQAEKQFNDEKALRDKGNAERKKSIEEEIAINSNKFNSIKDQQKRIVEDFKNNPINIKLGIDKEKGELTFQALERLNRAKKELLTDITQQKALGVDTTAARTQLNDFKKNLNLVEKAITDINEKERPSKALLAVERQVARLQERLEAVRGTPQEIPVNIELGQALNKLSNIREAIAKSKQAEIQLKIKEEDIRRTEGAIKKIEAQLKTVTDPKEKIKLETDLGSKKADLSLFIDEFRNLRKEATPTKGVIQQLEEQIKLLERKRKFALRDELPGINEELKKLNKELTSAKGEEPFSLIGVSATKLSEKLTSLASSFGLPTKTAGELGNVAGSAFNTVGQGAAGLVSKVGPVAGAIAPIAIAAVGATVAIGGLIAGLANAAKSASDFGKEQLGVSRATGVQAETVATLTTILGNARNTTETLLQLTQRVTEAGQGSETAGSQFKRLGIDVRDANNNLKSVGAIFDEIANKAQAAGFAESELASLQQIFGEEASKKLLPVIGRFGELRQAIRDANLAIGVDSAVAAESFGINLQKLDIGLQGISNTIGTAVLPSFDKVAVAAGDALLSFAKSDEFKDLVVQLKKFADDFIGTAGPPLVNLLKETATAAVSLGNSFFTVFEPIFALVPKAIAVLEPLFSKVLETVSFLSNSFAEGIGIFTQALGLSRDRSEELAEAQRKLSEETKKSIPGINSNAIAQLRAASSYESVGKAIENVIAATERKTRLDTQLLEVDKANAQQREISFRKQLLASTVDLNDFFVNLQQVSQESNKSLLSITDSAQIGIANFSENSTRAEEKLLNSRKRFATETIELDQNTLITRAKLNNDFTEAITGQQNAVLTKFIASQKGQTEAVGQAALITSNFLTNGIASAEEGLKRLEANKLKFLQADTATSIAIAKNNTQIAQNAANAQENIFLSNSRSIATRIEQLKSSIEPAKKLVDKESEEAKRKEEELTTGSLLGLTTRRDALVKALKEREDFLNNSAENDKAREEKLLAISSSRIDGFGSKTAKDIDKNSKTIADQKQDVIQLQAQINDLNKAIDGAVNKNLDAKTAKDQQAASKKIEIERQTFDAVSLFEAKREEERAKFLAKRNEAQNASLQEQRDIAKAEADFELGLSDLINKELVRKQENKIDEINRLEKDRTITATQASQQRTKAELDSINEQIKRLGELSNLPAFKTNKEQQERLNEEIIKLLEKARTVQKNSLKEQFETQKKDAEDLINIKKAQIDQELALTDIRNNKIIQGLRSIGATETDIRNFQINEEKKRLDQDLQKLKLDKDSLKQQGASQAEIIKKDTEIILLEEKRRVLLQEQADIIRNEQLKALEETLKKQDEAFARLKSNLKETGNILSQALSFKFNSDDLDSAIKKIAELRRNAESARASFTDLGKAIADSFDELADNLQAKVNAELEKARKLAELEAQEFANNIKTQAKNALESFVVEAAKLQQEHKARLKALKNEVIINQQELADAENQLSKRFNQAQKDLDEERAEDRVKNRRQELQEIFQQEFNFEQKLRDLKLSTRLGELSGDRANILEKASLRKNLNDLTTELSKTTDDEARKDLQQKINEIKAQISEVDSDLEERKNREARRRAALSSLEEDFRKKRAGATSKEELERLTREFDAAKDNVNSKFNLEASFKKDAKELRKLGDTEALAALEANYKEEQALLDQNLKDQQKAIEDDIKNKKAIRDQEEKEEQEAFERRKAAAALAFAEELQALREQTAARLLEIQERIREENKAFEKQLEDLQSRFADSLGQIASQLQDGNSPLFRFLLDLASGAGLSGKSLQELIAAIQKIASDLAQKAATQKIKDDLSGKKDDKTNGNPNAGNVLGGGSGNAGSGPFGLVTEEEGEKKKKRQKGKSKEDQFGSPFDEEKDKGQGSGSVDPEDSDFGNDTEGGKGKGEVKELIGNPFGTKKPKKPKKGRGTGKPDAGDSDFGNDTEGGKGKGKLEEIRVGDEEDPTVDFGDFVPSRPLNEVFFAIWLRFLAGEITKNRIIARVDRLIEKGLISSEVGSQVQGLIFGFKDTSEDGKLEFKQLLDGILGLAKGVLLPTKPRGSENAQEGDLGDIFDDEGRLLSNTNRGNSGRNRDDLAGDETDSQSQGNASTNKEKALRNLYNKAKKGKIDNSKFLRKCIAILGKKADDRSTIVAITEAFKVAQSAQEFADILLNNADVNPPDIKRSDVSNVDDFKLDSEATFSGTETNLTQSGKNSKGNTRGGDTGESKTPLERLLSIYTLIKQDKITVKSVYRRIQKLIDEGLIDKKQANEIVLALYNVSPKEIKTKLSDILGKNNEQDLIPQEDDDKTGKNVPGLSGFGEEDNFKFSSSDTDSKKKKKEGSGNSNNDKKTKTKDLPKVTTKEQLRDQIILLYKEDFLPTKPKYDYERFANKIFQAEKANLILRDKSKAIFGFMIGFPSVEDLIIFINDILEIKTSTPSGSGTDNSDKGDKGGGNSDPGGAGGGKEDPPNPTGSNEKDTELNPALNPDEIKDLQKIVDAIVGVYTKFYDIKNKKKDERKASDALLTVEKQAGGRLTRAKLTKIFAKMSQFLPVSDFKLFVEIELGLKVVKEQPGGGGSGGGDGSGGSGGGKGGPVQGDGFEPDLDGSGGTGGTNEIPKFELPSPQVSDEVKRSLPVLVGKFKEDIINIFKAYVNNRLFGGRFTLLLYNIGLKYLNNLLKAKKIQAKNVNKIREFFNFKDGEANGIIPSFEALIEEILKEEAQLRKDLLAASTGSKKNINKTEKPNVKPSEIDPNQKLEEIKPSNAPLQRTVTDNFNKTVSEIENVPTVPSSGGLDVEGRIEGDIDKAITSQQLATLLIDTYNKGYKQPSPGAFGKPVNLVNDIIARLLQLQKITKRLADALASVNNGAPPLVFQRNVLRILALDGSQELVSGFDSSFDSSFDQLSGNAGSTTPGTTPTANTRKLTPGSSGFTNVTQEGGGSRSSDNPTSKGDGDETLEGDDSSTPRTVEELIEELADLFIKKGVSIAASDNKISSKLKKYLRSKTITLSQAKEIRKAFLFEKILEVFIDEVRSILSISVGGKKGLTNTQKDFSQSSRTSSNAQSIDDSLGFGFNENSTNNNKGITIINKFNNVFQITANGNINDSRTIESLAQQIAAILNEQRSRKQARLVGAGSINR